MYDVLRDIIFDKAQLKTYNSNINSFTIKENNNTSGIPVVLVPAFNLNILNDDSFNRSKADHYIMKPITDFNKFLNEIRKMLN